MSWQPLAVHSRRTKQSLTCPYAGLRKPLVPRGLPRALIRCISSHGEMSRVVICFLGEAKEHGGMVREGVVLNRKNPHDSWQKPHGSIFFHEE